MNEKNGGVVNLGYSKSNSDLDFVGGENGNGGYLNDIAAVKTGAEDEVQLSETDETANDKRPVWGNSIEFLMSCISMSVGLGNIWRFPFTAYENGGGAFVIPYLIVLFLIGKPMYYMEMILGQFTSRSSIKVWSVCPALKGVGYGQICGTISVITYYTSLIALTLFYLFASFASELPWSKCKEEWGPYCVDSLPTANVTRPDSNGTIKFQSSSELYFLKEVLHEIDDISDGIGVPDWKLTLCLFGAWCVVFLCIVRGVKSSGKAAYFLALFPYVVMIILLVRAVTLDGAVNGIIFFLKPQWGELLNPKVWYSATTQLFFSLSVGMGTIIMFSSYNKFDHNIYRDALIVTSLDTVTSMMAGITIFGILGNLAHNLGIENIDEVVRSGTGLAFISYPDAISKFDWVPQVFSVLFFFMLFVLGIGSVVALQSAVVTVICDQFTGLKFWKVAIGTCFAGFLIGLIYVTPGGQWMLNLVDYFGGTFLIFALAIFQMMGIFWLYGIRKFVWDLSFMTNRYTGVYWRLCWTIITPILMAIIFIYSVVNMEPLRYSGNEYPLSGTIAGWTLLGIGLLQFPLWAFYIIGRNTKQSSSVREAIRKSFTPSNQWGPKYPHIHRDWLNNRKEKCEKYAIERSNKSHNWGLRKVNQLLGRYDSCK